MSQQIGSAPTYLCRNPYSYCFRMRVPADLQKYVGKKELRYSFNTGYLGSAKSKAGLLAGLMQRFFRTLRANKTAMKLSFQDIQLIVNRLIRDNLDVMELRRYAGADELFLGCIVRSWPRMGMTLLQDENFTDLSLILRR